MSDRQYIERAARQRRWMILAGLFVLLLACVAFGVRNVFYDRCTTSFERGHEAVARSYIEALVKGEALRAQDCWERAAYYDPGSGCSELCVERVLGAGMNLVGVQAETAPVVEGRDRRVYRVMVACIDGSQQSGTLVLDAPPGSLPWKHWRILQSEIGGSANQPWCGGG